MALPSSVILCTSHIPSEYNREWSRKYRGLMEVLPSLNDKKNKTQNKTIRRKRLIIADFKKDLSWMIEHQKEINSSKAHILIICSERDKNILLEAAHFFIENKRPLKFIANDQISEIERYLQICAQEKSKKIKSESSQLSFISDTSAQGLADVMGSPVIYSHRENLDHSQDTKTLTDTLFEMRQFVSFLKELTSRSSLESIIDLIKASTQSFSKAKPPLLIVSSLFKEPRLYFYQGPSLTYKSISDSFLKESTSLHGRENDKKIKAYLADILGRPFASLMTFHLQLSDQDLDSIAGLPEVVLFFEHDFSDKEKETFNHYIQPRLKAISTAIERIGLEKTLKESSQIWERTFDGLQDPVAVFDQDGFLLRANRAFHEKIKNISFNDLRVRSLQLGGRTYEIQSYAIDSNGEKYGGHTIHHFIDVTFSRQLQKQMIQSEKMAALGSMAGHIAHELNNPLTGIKSLSQVVLSEISNETSFYSDLVEVERAAERCQKIIRNLLDFASEGVQNKSVVSINEIVLRTIPLLKTAMARFDQVIELSHESLWIEVEPQLMQQVVFNLIKNACQAMGDKGVLEIRTFRHGSTVVLMIKDTGMGIAPENLKLIFDYFYTTKSHDQGTGLGLSMSQNIIEQFGGRIDVKSELGVGSEFTIELPLKENKTV